MMNSPLSGGRRASQSSGLISSPLGIDRKGIIEKLRDLGLVWSKESYNRVFYSVESLLG